jgi:acyl-CoA synthetase (AMP-forming)/AMP-acid ligase II/acyl carrier protein
MFSALPNSTCPADPNGWQSLVELLRWRALHQPDRLAYSFLLDGELKESHFTYGELDQRARTIATTLQQLDAHGKPVLLLFPPGLEFVAGFFGCVYAGAIAVPAYPPRFDRLLPQLQPIVDSAEAKLILTTAQFLTWKDAFIAQTPSLAALPWVITEQAGADSPADWQEPTSDYDTIALLQYTSGSTGVPKGSVITHGNVLENSALIRQCGGFDANSHGMTWLPPYHDLGLIGGLIQPLFSGFPVTLMSPLAFLEHPLRWLEAISHTRATTSGGPNFAYDLCVRKISEQEARMLDLSCWKVAFTAGERVRADTLHRFADFFRPAGFREEAFYPSYGLAETTLVVSGGVKEAPPVVRPPATMAMARDTGHATSVAVMPHSLVGCGKALPGVRVVIANPWTLRECPPGDVGEIWVRGPSIAQGYWHQREASEATFGARLSDTGEGPFLRTGDLGFLEDGELFVTGRRKDLIVVRGRNHSPEDIEITVTSSHPALRPGCCAAFSIESADGEQLVIASEVIDNFKDAEAPDVCSAICSAVAGFHGLEATAVLLVARGCVPKTPSGKIRRHSCRMLFLSQGFEPVGHWHKPVAVSHPAGMAADVVPSHGPLLTTRDIEIWLCVRLAHRLGLEVADVEGTRPFAQYGLDSASAVELTAELSSVFGMELHPTIPWDYPTPHLLAQYLASVHGGQSIGRVRDN